MNQFILTDSNDLSSMCLNIKASWSSHRIHTWSQSVQTPNWKLSKAYDCKIAYKIQSYFSVILQMKKHTESCKNVTF